MWCLSKNELQRKMEFLVKKVEYTASHIARHPILLFSLKNRMIPRYRVMENCKSKGLHRGHCKHYTIFSLSENVFMQKIVLIDKEKGPELLDIYVST